MALILIKEEKVDETKAFKADKRYFLTADNSRLVEENDPAAATLYAAKGDYIPMDQAKRFGLISEFKKPKESFLGAESDQKSVDEAEVKKKVIWPKEDKRLGTKPISKKPKR